MQRNYQKACLSRVLIAIVLSVFATYYFLGKQAVSSIDNSIETKQLLVNNSEEKNLSSQLLYDVWDKLQEKYVDPEVFIENEAFEYGIIKGLVSGLKDPYSEFMTPEENKSFRDGLHGNFEGIGAELTMKSGIVTVVTPLKGSPAKIAGLMPEDIILKVDEEDITELSLIEVVKKIRGEKGTEVTLNVYRPSLKDSLDITIIRDVITINSVESEIKDGIAYIEINQFGDDTREEFSKHMKDIKEKDIQGIVLDLRFNGGGYLDGAVDIASAFLEPGAEVVEVKTKTDSFSHSASYKSFNDTTVPLVILINKGSASAAEIVAGALQDHKRAVIIGEQSFGKGTVQEVIPLQGGASLRVTIAEWLTPNGKSINKEGIHPNIIVEKTKEDYESETTPQLDKAMEIVKSENWKESIN